jgi:UDP-N-acetylmuramoyl-tripeptide--D-alanyl-D-alanine ligase
MATPIPPNRATFTLAEVARATGGQCRGDAGGQVCGVVTDSRAVQRGNLFVALRGERHDGHDHLTGAVAAGASALLVCRDAACPAEVPVVEVGDTLRALGDLAAFHRRRWGRPVVTITGSAGKTSTKELVAAALRGAGLRVHRTAGNLNNLVGLPLTLLELGDDVDVAVVEAGTNRPGEIARLAEVSAPDVGVVTLVAAAHTEGLGTLEQVGAEKGALFMALGASGTAVANADDPLVGAWAGRCPAERTISFGTGEGADVRVLTWCVEPELRTRVEVTAPGRDAPLTLRLRLLGEAAALNAAAAVAVAAALDADLDAAGGALEEVAPAPGRMRPVAGERDTLLLDDSYNANRRSMELALDTAAEVARVRDGRVIAVLADMKELGDRSQEDHRAVGEHAARVGVAALVAVGPEMGCAAEAAARRGVRVVVAANPEEATEAVRDVALEGDIILVKGSRSMRTERVVHALHEGGEAA